MSAPLATPLEIVRTRSLASLVAQEIEGLILSGQIAPGERLNEQALAARLGVSRGPVREAVRGLERSGLVVAVVNQGSYVRTMRVEEALQVFDIRVALTGHAAASVAARATPALLAPLERIMRDLTAAERADDAATYYALNLEFHAALFELAANPRAAQLYDGLGKELHLFRRRALLQPENMRQSNAEHAAILQALRDGDVAAARAAGEHHIVGGRARFAASHPSDQSRPQQVAGGESDARRKSGLPPG
ncbi:GntR family transcriptional regulator [Teichococcus vastitatis]|jgi:DNA-binding GntR family transcriptional regulator|uniref:GntR family transcriptional regulator n=1 Tax=Teichococcus vastitatis TaxID=2307076 RepID=A0ABS9W7V5_9PROT|nr:GntR family transcriptional regulator [Pseudoroseomonas vastitatis]MCI0755376.1 GntR family transcriptional regulator [Pseudoroseomonas vastitatis]